jgi:two-component system response regulator YesN
MLSKRSKQTLATDYKRRFGLPLRWVKPDGEFEGLRSLEPALRLPTPRQAIADALQEAVRWGEPHVFFISPGVMSWMIPLMDCEELLGGVTGGEVLTDETDRKSCADYLRSAGCSASAANRFSSALPVWPQSRPREAAMFLYDLFYAVTGWKPVLLVRNRENAAQQRQIAEEIQQNKIAERRAYPYDEERILLSLIRVGDKKGARRVLNKLLAAMFLNSPKLAVVRARAIEMMGYLVRTAVEDSPMLEPLIEQNHRWIEKIITADDFDVLCEALRDALDNFIDGIFQQGFNRTNETVRRVIDYLAGHFAEPITLADVARVAGLSPFRTAHLVREHTGKSVMQHVKRMRIQRAHDLLETTNKSGAEIAAELGFHDQSHFVRHFRKLAGTTPGHYRRQRAGK